MGKQFKVCPWCGSHLDYGERCDCRERDANEGGHREDTERDGKRKPALLERKAG